VKEFTTAVEDVVAEDVREEKIVALVATGKTREEAEAEVESEEGVVEFMLDGRTMKAYPLEDGQLAFMLAARSVVGRAKSSGSRPSST
jgi:hypothetical protein